MVAGIVSILLLYFIPKLIYIILKSIFNYYRGDDDGSGDTIYCG